MGKKKKKTKQKVIVVRPGVLNQADADRFSIACKKYIKKVTKTKETAQKALQKLGIHTPTGRITKRYR